MWVIVIVIILIVLFWYLTTQQPEIPVCPQRKCKKESLADPVFDDSGDNRIKIRGSQDAIQMRANSTGLKSSGQFVNSALEGQSQDQDFNQQYAQLIQNEIGEDVVDSQQQYIKSIPTDNSIKYLDSQLETNYVNWSGLSLSRLTAPNVNSSNSTQIQGVDTSDYTSNTGGSLRSYLVK